MQHRNALSPSALGIAILIAGVAALCYWLLDGPSPDSDVVASPSAIEAPFERNDAPVARGAVDKPVPIPIGGVQGDAATRANRGAGGLIVMDYATGEVVTDAEWLVAVQVSPSSPKAAEGELQLKGGEHSLPPGLYRITSKADLWVLNRHEFEVESGRSTFLYAARAGEFAIRVVDAAGVFVAGADVIVGPASLSTWSDKYGATVFAPGVLGKSHRANQAGLVRLVIDRPGRYHAYGGSQLLGCGDVAFMPRPGRVYDLVLSKIGAAHSTVVVDHETGRPVQGAVLSSGEDVLSAPSGVSGQISYWPSHSSSSAWIVSAPGYAPLSLASPAVFKRQELRLYRQVELGWEVVGADADGDAVSGAVTIEKVALGQGGEIEACLSSWAHYDATKGVFIVPAGAEVNLTAVFGSRVASETVNVSGGGREVVRLRLERAASALLVDIESVASQPRVAIIREHSERRMLRAEQGVVTIPLLGDEKLLVIESVVGPAALSSSVGGLSERAGEAVRIEYKATSPQRLLAVDLQGNVVEDVVLELMYRDEFSKIMTVNHAGFALSSFGSRGANVAMLAGEAVLDLPSARYGYTVRSASSGEVVGGGNVAIPPEPASHELIVSRVRWVSLNVTWDDGVPVERFDVRYSRPWATDPDAVWAEAVLHGRGGRIGAWIPSEHVSLLITAEGTHAAERPLAPAEDEAQVLLYREAAERFLELRGLDESGVLGVKLEVFNERGTLASTHFLSQAASGRYRLPPVELLVDRSVIVSVRSRGRRWSSGPVDGGSLDRGPVYVYQDPP